MRVTDRTMLLTYMRGLRDRQSDMDLALNRMADGKRVRHASDDPSGAAQSLELRARLSRLAGFRRSGGLGRLDLELLDGVLGQAHELVSQARVLAEAGASSPSGSTANAVRAVEVEGVRDQLLALANTARGTRFLFAGTETLTRPFDASGAYAGNANESETPIDNTLTVASTLSGQRVFIDGGDIFTTLADLATAMRANDTAAIGARVVDLSAQLGHLSTIRAEVGFRLNLIDGTLTRHEDEELRLVGRVAELEDARLEQALTEFTAADNALQALSMGAARALSRSLFDYLG